MMINHVNSFFMVAIDLPLGFFLKDSSPKSSMICHDFLQYKDQVQQLKILARYTVASVLGNQA